MSLKFYAVENHCDSKAMSKFRAMEERFDSLDECCRAKFPQSIADCCSVREGECSLSGNLKFIPVSIFLSPLEIDILAPHTCINIADTTPVFVLTSVELARSNLLHQR